jgi:hypothetical protein
MKYSLMRARGGCMTKLDQPNRILFLDSKMRIFSVQWAVVEVEEVNSRIHKIFNRYFRIFSVAISTEEEGEDAADKPILKNYLKTSVYYVKSILMNQ